MHYSSSQNTQDQAWKRWIESEESWCSSRRHPEKRPSWIVKRGDLNHSLEQPHVLLNGSTPFFNNLKSERAQAHVLDKNSSELDRIDSRLGLWAGQTESPRHSNPTTTIWLPHKFQKYSQINPLNQATKKLRIDKLSIDGYWSMEFGILASSMNTP